MVSLKRLTAMLGFQIVQIQVAEGVIDRQGLTPQYRRALAARIRKDQADGEDHPTDLAAAAIAAAECQGLPPRVADQRLPIDEWMGEEE